MSSQKHKQLIWNLIKDIKVGMLVTKENDDDSMRARPMHLVQDEYDNTLYFFTSKEGAKIFEIEEDKDVCITFSNPDDSVYVSLSGKAKLTEDRALIHKYWNPWVGAWFENGKEDSDIAMLEVKVNKGEHWDSKNNKFVQLFEIAKSNVMPSTTPNIGENEEFGTE